MTRLDESHWIFGRGIHLHFANGGEPVALPSVPNFVTGEGCASVSDDQGQLLFYTDGRNLWDRGFSQIDSGLGGNSSSTHSAIVIPPAGGGSEYHVFCVGADDDDVSGNLDRISHSSYTVTGGVVSVAAASQTVGFMVNSDATERLAATSHADCDKYWVAAQNQDEELIVFLVEGDVATLGQRPSAAVAGGTQTWIVDNDWEGGQAKFSPDGTFYAYCDHDGGRIVILGFDSQTGVFTQWLEIDGVVEPYGLEFSPNGRLLYYATTGFQAPGVHQVPLSSGPATAPIPHSSTFVVTTDRLQQLQLGPNNKIYGAIVNTRNLAVIEDPDQPLAASSYRGIALDASGNPLDTGELVRHGLPTFTRIPDRCRRSDCEMIAEKVDDALWDATCEHHESMQPCDDRAGPLPRPRPRPWPHPKDPAKCRSLRFERPEPAVFITHSDSDCDCLESDDVETMSVTVCNRNSNITLTDLTIQSIELVDPNGQPPAQLPDGSPSVEITPIGPFCFGDIPPCSCVSRQFSMRLRGAVAGTYRLKITAMCFDWRVTETQQRCFEFEVCAD